MRKFLILCAAAVLVLLAGNYLIYHTSYYIDWRPDEAISSFTGTSGREILVDRGDGPAPFEIRGVDLGVGKPGHLSLIHISHSSFSSSARMPKAFPKSWRRPPELTVWANGQSFLKYSFR